MRVERFSLFFPPLLVRKKRGETEYAIGAVPLGGYVKITGMNPQEELPPDIAPRSYYHQPVWKRIVVIAAGPAMNILTALILLFCFFTFGVKQITSQVNTVEPNMPAAQVLKPGDRVVSVDGTRGGPLDFRNQILRHKCSGRQVEGCRAKEPARLVVLRGGRQIRLTIYPRYDTTIDPPGLRLGFRYGSEHVTYGPLVAAGKSLDGAWRITTGTFKAVVGIFQPKGRKQISGVVGGYKATAESFSFDFWQAVLVLAVISMSLALINLFPFLPLDGGHIFFSLVEKIRGRAVSFAVMERASVLGFMIVIMLFLVGLSNDIGKLTSGKDFIPK